MYARVSLADSLRDSFGWDKPRVGFAKKGLRTKKVVWRPFKDKHNVGPALLTIDRTTYEIWNNGIVQYRRGSMQELFGGKEVSKRKAMKVCKLAFKALA